MVVLSDAKAVGKQIYFSSLRKEKRNTEKHKLIKSSSYGESIFIRGKSEMKTGFRLGFRL